jgi:hypothetical protein
MHEITEKWYGAAGDFKPKTDRDYSWVWEYAKFRFEWAFNNGRYIGEKAISLLQHRAAGVWYVRGGRNVGTAYL